MSTDRRASPLANRWWAGVAGLRPLPAPPGAFAVEPRLLRYGRFGRDGAVYRFQEYHALELAEDTFQSGPLGGPLRDPQAFRRQVALLLERVSAPVREASLLVPDAWLRVGFAESGELPRAAEARDEVLRWKLKRLVPYRVEELRVSAVEVEPLPGQEEPRRLLLGFAIELLLGQLEEAFAAHGVELGFVCNSSLALLAALRPESPSKLGGVLAAGDDGYALVVARGGRPLLHRFKSWNGALPEAERATLVERDLRLTASFLAESLPGTALERLYLSAPPHLEPAWLSLIDRGLGSGAARVGAPLRPENLRLAGGQAPPAWRDAAPLLGAVCQEVR